MSYSKAIIMGRIGNMKDLIHVGEKQTAKLAFSIATEDMRKTTHWHNVIAWGKRAEVIQQYFNKGDGILIEGSLEYNSYEKDGVKKGPYTNIIVSEIGFVPGPRKPKDERGDDNATAPVFTENDIPF